MHERQSKTEMNGAELYVMPAIGMRIKLF